MKPAKIGVVGCGMISDYYFKAAKRFSALDMALCADLDEKLAAAKGELYGIKAVSCDELFADPEIEIVLNLTPPKAHNAVAKAALLAGKHTYSEKPFGVDLAEADEIMRLASEKHLAVGCAPDTFLGGGQQTSRKLIDDGWIGKPLAGTAMVMSRGPEDYPHAPFFYDKGGGPMLDLGPYYITSLVNLLGPVESVTAETDKFSDFRTGGPETVPRVFPVNVDTHQSGTLRFVSGAIVTVIASFDVRRHGHPPIEIYGSEGSLAVPNPNTFGGPVKLFRPGNEEWKEIPLSHIYDHGSRSIGLADMVTALREGRPFRASGELAYHVLEVMLGFCESSRLGRRVGIKSRCERPAPLPLGLRDGEISLP